MLVTYIHFMIKFVKIPFANSDKIGVFTSILCLIHCLAAPFLYLLVGKSSQINTWYGSIDIVLITVSFIAIYRSARLSARRYMQIGFYTLWILLLTSVLNERVHWIKIPDFFTYVFSIGLAIWHMLNRRFCLCDKKSCCH